MMPDWGSIATRLNGRWADGVYRAEVLAACLADATTDEIEEALTTTDRWAHAPTPRDIARVVSHIREWPKIKRLIDEARSKLRPR